MTMQRNIGYLIQHVAFVLARQSDQVLQERLGIGFSQFKIMMVLRDNPHVQQRQIADSLAQTEASISRQIKLLHELGMLSTQVNPENRRVHITTLTAKGERLAEEALNVLNSYHEPMFGQFSEKQQKQLLEILSIMHDTACQPGRTAACHHLYTTD